MSTALERLRRLQALRPQRAHDDPPLPAPLAQAATPSDAQTSGRLEELVPGEVIETTLGVCYLQTQTFPLQSTRGPQPLGALLQQQPAKFAPYHPNFGLHASSDYTEAVFVDTETTGLGGGAGVYCFMVGVGTFERLPTADWRPETPDAGRKTPDSRRKTPDSATHFVVRQFFMRHPAEEGALLMALAELLDRHTMSVTFNGRTFDLPLLRTRLTQNQHMYPDLRGSGRLLAPDRPHLDLLHPARRLWRRRLQSCRLINLEQEVLGLTRSEEDVPGALIPQLYLDFVRSGDAQAMRRVFYHNLEDVLTMVGLAERLGAALAQPEAAALRREDWLALATFHEDRARWADAELAYRRALAELRDPQAKAEAYARLGRLLKRQQRWDEAAELWQLWLTNVPGVDPAPYVELAKYCEWQAGDCEQAAMWTQWALHNLRTAPAWQCPPGAQAALEHRLARLQRKQAAAQ